MSDPGYIRIHKPHTLNSFCSNIKFGYLDRKPKKGFILHGICEQYSLDLTGIFVAITAGHSRWVV